MLAWGPNVSVIDWSTVEPGIVFAVYARSYVNERMEVRVREPSVRAEDAAAAVDPKGLDWGDQELKIYGNACEEKSECSARASGREHCEYGQCQSDRAAYDRPQARKKVPFLEAR